MPRRIKLVPPYLFAALDKARTAAKERGLDVISLGIGDPDTNTPDDVVEELAASAGEGVNQKYPSYIGSIEFREAAADFYKHRFSVDLDPESEVIAVIGAKEAIAHFILGVVDVGDTVLIPDPAYPVYEMGTHFAGGLPVRMPISEESGFLPDLSLIPEKVAEKAVLMFLNYPNNPTTATADLEFFKRVIEFGRQHNILIAHDSAYSENTYDGYKAPSILEVDGADEVAVEFFSLSKGFNMTGWRLGFVVGNVSAITALDKVKNNIDNGSLRALQFAGAKALSVVDEIIPPINAVYKRRRDMVVDGLNSNGWSLEKPKATIYIWAPVPDGYNGQSTEFATELLEKSGVVVTPGLLYGQWGEGYFRISLTYPDEVIQEAISRLAEMRL